MSIEIEATDVIRLIAQFLKEGNLHRTLRTLQDETGLNLNTIDSVDQFAREIHDGNWDLVLQALQTVKLSDARLMDVYEQVTLELIEQRELGAARSLLRQTDIMNVMKQLQPERYLHLETLLSRSYFDQREAYGDSSSREKRRAQIAQSLISEISIVPPSRLLTLIGQSLKWQREQGMLPAGAKLDVFRGRTILGESEEERCPATLSRTIKFTEKAHVERAIFTPDGGFLVTGAVDGFLEFWNYQTGKLRKDLRYQATEQFLMVDGGAAILALATSSDSEMVAAGSQDGRITVWRIANGSIIRRFDAAHAKGVTSLRFSRDDAHLLSTSFDHSVRIHGMRSGRMLKEFRGHTSFVNDAVFIEAASSGAAAASNRPGTSASTSNAAGNESRQYVVSGGADGSVRVWNVKTCECISVFKNFLPQSGDEPASQVSSGKQQSAVLTNAKQASVAVTAVIAMRTAEQVLVVTRSDTLVIMNLSGQIVRAFQTASVSPQRTNFVCATLSPRNDYLYAVGDDHSLYCFTVANGKLERSFAVHERDVIGVSHHPAQNIVCTYAEDGQVRIWRA